MALLCTRLTLFIHVFKKVPRCRNCIRCLQDASVQFQKVETLKTNKRFDLNENIRTANCNLCPISFSFSHRTKAQHFLQFQREEKSSQLSYESLCRSTDVDNTVNSLVRDKVVLERCKLAGFLEDESIGNNFAERSVFGAVVFRAPWN